MEVEKEVKDNWMFYVAGVQHHRLHKCIMDLEVGKSLSLVLEPTNTFDKNAVQVVHSNMAGDIYQLGYVPKKSSKEIHDCLVRPGKITTCTITRLEPDEKPWMQLQVIVRREG